MTRPLSSDGSTLSISLAMRLEEARQLQMLAERLDRLVDGEAGDVGGDLEQHAAGLAEVDRAEVVAVLLLGRMHAVLAHELLRHRGLLGIVGGAERDVMHRAAALTAAAGNPRPRRCRRCRPSASLGA